MMGSQFGYQPPIILLKDGTDESQGTGQLLTNINAALGLCDIVKTTLGPRGMDKLIADANGRRTVSNDGATIVKCLDVVHPAARVVADIAEAQDKEIGDGTTSVLVLAGGILRNIKPLIEEGIHPRVAIRALRYALSLALDKIEAVAVKLGDESQKRERLLRLAGTAMNSKLIAPCKGLFAEIAVGAVEAIGSTGNPKLIGMKLELGGSLSESKLIQGVCFKKTFSYAGFEQLPKKILNPRIILLNIELEWKSERSNAKIRIENPSQFREIVDAEFRIIYNKLDRLVQSGANIVLSKLPIGDLATQYFVDHGVFCAGRVPEDDIMRLAACTGARVLTAVTDIAPEAIGTCAVFEERQLGSERYNFFGVEGPSKAVTVIIRGGAEQFVQESERSLHDAIEVVRRSIAHGKDDVVAGGGAIEMITGTYLKQVARTIPGKQQIVVEAFGTALEEIPRQLAINAGFDATEVISHLQAAHMRAYRAGETCWMGVDIMHDDSICDAMEANIWEPKIIKINALRAATEAACLILSVDSTVTNPQSTEVQEGRQQTAAMKSKLAAAGMGTGASGAIGQMGAGVRQLQGKGGR